jgi:hydrogenase maturation factor HypF (carbamoyltransferase family)
MRRVRSKPKAKAQSASQSPRMYLIPCSCGTTFSVAAQYDQCGSAWSRFLICPECGKRHDPRNRLLQLGYHREGYWKVDGC